MSDEKLAWEYIQKASTRSHRFSISILIIFAITTLSVIFGGVFLAKTEQQAYAFLYYGLPTGLSVLFIVYVINWFYCYLFLKREKQLQIEDIKLRRLLGLNKLSSILFMIPITFPIGMLGFQKVKVFSKDTYRRGTLDEILFNLLIAREGDSIFEKLESKLDVEETKYVKTASLLAKIGGSILIVISMILLIVSMIFPTEMATGSIRAEVTIWDITTYPSLLVPWIILLIALHVVGFIGLMISKLIRRKLSTPHGVILIVLGIPMIGMLGTGLLYIIAGIQIILAKRSQGITT